MKDTVLITGANSFIAKHLVKILEGNYHIKLLTRSPKTKNEYVWNVGNRTIDEKALDDVSYIVHLAGAKLNDGSPLTDERKKLVYDSRIGAAKLLKDKLKERGQKLTSFVSASAIGFYGFDDRTVEISESGNRGAGFAADLSDDWEKAADEFKTENIATHVAKIRVALVLGNDGGIFPILKESVLQNPSIALKTNLASYPWNHVKDMAGIFAHAVTHQLDGVYNSVAPVSASLQDIFKAISNETKGTKFSIAPFKGQHLIAQKIMEAGYQFKYPSIENAIHNLINT